LETGLLTAAGMVQAAAAQALTKPLELHGKGWGDPYNGDYLPGGAPAVGGSTPNGKEPLKLARLSAAGYGNPDTFLHFSLA
jgi:hypothetical protein